MKNYSKQREEVLNVLKQSYAHPTAEEIYETLKGMGSTSSRSTVYRNLGVLEQEDLIIKIATKDGPDRYDFIKECHHHVICKSCKRVMDFKYDFNFNEIKKTLEKQTGMDSFSEMFTIYGLCEDCNKSQELN